MVRLGLPRIQEDSIIIHRVNVEKDLAISKKTKVGCVIEGVRQTPTRDKEYEYFGGSNIELSTTYVYHAEMIALTDCIMHRFYPIKLFVSSQSKEENVFLCGDCRQQLLEVNKNCEIFVLNPDGTVKGNLLVWQLLPKHKNVDEKNDYFYKLLYGG